MEMERVKREYTIVHTDTLRSTSYLGYRVGQASHSNEQPANSPIYIMAYLPTCLPTYNTEQMPRVAGKDTVFVALSVHL